MPPENWPTSPVIPYLVVDGGTAAIAFYKAAFGAEELSRQMTADGKKVLNAMLRVNGAPVMLNDDFPEFSGGRQSAPRAGCPTSVSLHLSVADCDASYKRAVDAGANGTMPPNDAFWGDRYAQITDPFGHNWSFGSPLRETTSKERDDFVKKNLAGMK
jgi:PhnB protein